MEKQHLLKFGAFELKADESVLELDGKAVALTPKMFDTLLVLVKNQGRIVEKNTLMREVWPDSFVEEGNIAFNIRQLRKALGDSAQSPTFIETVPKRGYRFIADVELVESSPNSPLALETAVQTSPPNTKRRSLVILIGIAVSILISALLIFYFPLSGSSRLPLFDAPFSSEKLSADGNAYHAILSPDGKTIYYTHRDGGGRQSLWQRQIETSNSIQILPTSDDFYGGLEVSRDGQTLYFARGSQSGRQLDIYKMPTAGGIPAKIVEGSQGWISVSRDGSRISFVRCPYSDDEYCSLYIADAADGKNERKLATRPRPIRIATNQISPDGRKVAFAAGQSRTASNDFGLFEVDVDTGAERRMTEEKFFNIGYVAYLAGQEGILITAMRRPEHTYPIWNVSIPDGTVSKLTNDSETYSRLGLDASNSLLLATRITPDFKLYLTSTQKPAASPTVIADAATVTFAPDGKLIFSSTMTGNSEIWSVNADGTDQRQLTNDASADTAPIVSPDGKYIYFGSDRTGVLQVWRMNADGTDAVQITAEEGGYPTVVSPDGRWLYYRGGLTSAIRRVEAATGKEELIAGDLGRCMTVSPDASTIAFSKRDGEETTIFVYSIAEAKVIRSFNTAIPKMDVRQIAWASNGKTLSYILTDVKRENGRLFNQNLDGGTPKESADLGGDSIGELSALAASPDGNSVAIIRGSWKHDVFLIKGLK